MTRELYSTPPSSVTSAGILPSGILSPEAVAGIVEIGVADFGAALEAKHPDGDAHLAHERRRRARAQDHHGNKAPSGGTGIQVEIGKAPVVRDNTDRAAVAA